MAVVNGLTAERMLAIEGASVVDGTVNVDGHLVLTKHDGTTIDAGSVAGPQGAPGYQLITYRDASITPPNYPVGLSLFSIASETGWPTTDALVITFYMNNGRTFQMVTKKITGEVWMRSADDSVGGTGWGSFSKIANTTYVDNSISTAIAPLATTSHVDTVDATKADKTYVDTLVIGQELGIVDLNTITTPGTYWQSANVDASSGSNYPSPNAGVLEVFKNDTSTMVWQRYTLYNGTYSYWRSSYNGTWYAWVIGSAARQIYNFVAADLSAPFTLRSGYPALVTRELNIVHFQMQTSISAVVNSGATLLAAGKLPTWARPSGIRNISVGGTFSSSAATSEAEVQADGTVKLWDGSAPSGTIVKIFGSWSI